MAVQEGPLRRDLLVRLASADRPLRGHFDASNGRLTQRYIGSGKLRQSAKAVKYVKQISRYQPESRTFRARK
jgi:hypothetical protein